MNVKKLTILTESGYGPIETSYKEKLTLSTNRISYEKTPYVESEENKKQKWSYQSICKEFRQFFEGIAVETQNIIDNADIECTDVGMITFTVIYENNVRTTKNILASCDCFASYFELFRPLVPQLEDLPCFLECSSFNDENS